MAVMNTYNYSKPKNFVRMAPVPTGLRVSNNNGNVAPAAGKMDQYLEQHILGARPEELTYMLYEGMVRFIKKAMIALDGGDYAQTNTFTQRAQNILSELRSTLNMDIPMSRDLDVLYEYTEFTLLEANIAKNAQKFSEALEMAEEFKNTWQQAFGLGE